MVLLKTLEPQAVAATRKAVVFVMSVSAEPTDQPPIVPAMPKRPRFIVFVSVALLVTVLMGGSLFWLLHSTMNRSGSLTKATHAAGVTGTPTWVPTEVTPPPEALFYDTFVNNNHGWSLTGDNTDFRILVDNMLILANTSPNTTLVESVPTSTTLDNYSVSIDFTINQGGSGDSTGLYLRGDSNLDHDYRVDVNGNNTFDIAKEWLDAQQNPQTTLLFAPQQTSDLRPLGAKNTLTVIMLDQTITVLINDQALITISDSSYINGQIALFVRHATSVPRTIVSFSRVEIDRLASPFTPPGQTPTVTPAAGD